MCGAQVYFWVLWVVCGTKHLALHMNSLHCRPLQIFLLWNKFNFIYHTSIKRIKPHRASNICFSVLYDIVQYNFKTHSRKSKWDFSAQIGKFCYRFYSWKESQRIRKSENLSVPPGALTSCMDEPGTESWFSMDRRSIQRFKRAYLILLWVYLTMGI